MSIDGLEFDHIGIAVSNLDACNNYLSSFSDMIMISEMFRDVNQNIKISFADFYGVKVELIEPLNKKKKSPVDKYLEKNITYYHICFRTMSLEDTISKMEDKGALVVIEPINAVAFNNKKIAFLLLKHLGLIELLEK